MKANVLARCLIGLLATTGIMVTPLQADTIEVEVTNLTHGIYFTPLLITAHGEGSHLFEAGMPASSNLREMAECGDISALVAALGGADADTVANPAEGLLGPGETTTALLDNTGTEANSAAASSIPGPAEGGEGYNPVKSDAQAIHIHPGVVSRDDGLTGSALDQSHRFLGPVARLVVERIQ